MTAKKRKTKAAVARQLVPFDVSRHLNSEVVIAEYLAVALEDPNPDMFLRAVANVAKARGMASVAEASGSDGRACTKHSHPEQRFDTRQCESWWIRSG